MEKLSVFVNLQSRVLKRFSRKLFTLAENRKKNSQKLFASITSKKMLKNKSEKIGDDLNHEDMDVHIKRRNNEQVVYPSTGIDM